MIVPVLVILDQETPQTPAQSGDATTAAPTGGAAPGTTAPAPDGILGAIGGFVPFILIIGIFYFLMIAPERKQRKKREAMLAAVKKGDKVVTTGGMFATVAAVNEDSITLQASDDVRLRFTRQSIATVIEVEGGELGQELIRRLRRIALCSAPVFFARRLEPCTEEIGEIGERLAARFLVRSGLELLGRRVATTAGEVDLVFSERGRLVCVEVKTTASAPGSRWRPGDRWRRKAYERQRAAARILHARGFGRRDAQPRLDLVEVWIGRRRSAPTIRHHRGLHGPLS